MKQRKVLSLAGGGGSSLTANSNVTDSQPAKLWKALSAFTMAEILLSLTIIGVVAAITLPSLTGNINERTWNTQRKALYARFSQAIALMPALNGYGTLSGTISDDGTQDITEDNAAETFVTDGLSKVLKINNICDSDHLEDCGLPEKMTTLAGSVTSFPKTLADLNPANTSAVQMFTETYSKAYKTLNTKAAGFETANGESIAVYYNPKCTYKSQANMSIMTQGGMCANFVYDLNGSKGPNTFGKDIGIITAYYPVDGMVVAPMPAPTDAVRSVEWANVGSVCKNQDGNYRLPTNEDWMSMFTNRNLIGNLTGLYWTSSTSSGLSNEIHNDGMTFAMNHWYFLMDSGLLHNDVGAYPRNAVRCIKR